MAKSDTLICAREFIVGNLKNQNHHLTCKVKSQIYITTVRQTEGIQLLILIASSEAVVRPVILLILIV